MQIINGYNHHIKEVKYTAMKTQTTKTLKVLFAAALLLGQTACTGVQSSPGMVDYSYVPAQRGVSVVPAPGIQDY